MGSVLKYALHIYIYVIKIVKPIFMLCDIVMEANPQLIFLDFSRLLFLSALYCLLLLLYTINTILTLIKFSIYHPKIVWCLIQLYSLYQMVISLVFFVWKTHPILWPTHIFSKEPYQKQITKGHSLPLILFQMIPKNSLTLPIYINEYILLQTKRKGCFSIQHTIERPGVR